MFKKVLIANRGEIACRVIQTCRKLGITSVVVYSDVDAHGLHVRMADEAIRIGAALASESYLNIDRVLAAAVESGSEAIHPGFGFLSENAEFVRRCDEAGIAFIGPTANTIDAMGSKSEAKAIMEKAGVPVVPGYHGDKQDLKTLAQEAKHIGFPLMIKASAGGGGKGMRIVQAASEFEDALAGARREAKNAFGDDHVLLEKFVTSPRHIEFQVFGDTSGNIIHLFERECSIQRRYQKVLEETPSKFVDDALRGAMGKAAVDAAATVNYVNAGTVEFIVGADREFYFMEMNTRLQVEHPVTEAVTGLDLVEWQLRVASGETLPLSQEQVSCNGHAIEVRLYAEDPDRDFLPATGEISQFSYPDTSRNFRVDTGISSGDEISIHYDPMIAKLIGWNIDRESCISSLRESLAATAVFGLTTNIELLRAILANEDYQSGSYDTLFIDKHRESLAASAENLTIADCIAAAARDWLDQNEDLRWNVTDPYSPWHAADGWQANGRGGVRYRFADQHGKIEEILLRDSINEFEVRSAEGCSTCSAAWGHDDMLDLEISGKQVSLRVRREADQYLVQSGTRSISLQRKRPFAHDGSKAIDETHPGSPMPGRIVAVHVKSGDTVKPGDALLVLEGMKMEFTLKATVTGEIENVLHNVGEMVDAETPLVDIKTAE